MINEIKIPCKGQCLCNKGCVRVGNLTDEEADICRSKCLCDKCDTDVRVKCYQKYIIENNTSIL